MDVVNSEITSIGFYLPNKVIKNTELDKSLNTNDEWIKDRTGIEQRHLVADDEYTSDLAINAAKKAIEKSDIKAEELDYIIVATTTPDYSIGSTACMVQSAINAKNAAAFDINAACSGFIYGLSLADNFIKNNKAKHILIIGAETMSRVVDWNDRRTCILFGDGAGAVLLSSTTNNEFGILDCNIGSDGSQLEILRTDGGVSRSQTAGHLLMNGKEVFKRAIIEMTNIVKLSLQRTKMQPNDIDFVIGHQANLRILQGVAEKLKIKEEKVISTIGQHANTSAASIPLALAHTVERGIVEKGNIITMPALGAGLTWGNCLIKWSL